MKSESNVSIHQHTHIHIHTVYAQIICPLHCYFSILLTQSNRRNHHHLHTFFSFRRAYLFFSFINNIRIYHPSFCIFQQKKGKKKISYVLMITMMIYMFYTLLLLEKFNNEMYSSMPTIGEIEAGGENEERKNKE
jgi:hypothetical protein